MSELVLLQILLQVGIPVGLIAWIAYPRRRSRAALALEVLFTGLWLAAAAMAGLWLALPQALTPVLAALLLLATLQALRHGEDVMVPSRAEVMLRGVAVLVGSMVLIQAVNGRRAPGSAIDLMFPLEHGTWLVASGGSNGLVNPHLKTLDGARYAAWRGQSYGLDIVGVGMWGSRHHGLAPRNPATYAIFGAVVRAPCSGEVVQVRDGVEDLPVPQRNDTERAGNHVIVECDGIWVVLAHLQRGSVRVQAGDSVRAGDGVGRVGNSGASDEPHLHVHAQEPGTADAPIGGAPLHARFDGRWLARNQRVTS